jgi:hypothetical protein
MADFKIEKKLACVYNNNWRLKLPDYSEWNLDLIYLQPKESSFIEAIRTLEKELVANLRVPEIYFEDGARSEYIARLHEKAMEQEYRLW